MVGGGRACDSCGGGGRRPARRHYQWRPCARGRTRWRPARVVAAGDALAWIVGAGDDADEFATAQHWPAGIAEAGAGAYAASAIGIDQRAPSRAHQVGLVQRAKGAAGVFVGGAVARDCINGLSR